MVDFQIVGIMLIKNEDLFIERVILNVIQFCDKLIITDHQSTDKTYGICQRLADEFSKIDLQKIRDTKESVDVLVPYYGTKTWIFAVDGDELYDPVGLKIMRQKLLSGFFSETWCIFGNVLNVISLDNDQKKAKGYLAPPARSMTKLYNFSIIEDWPDCKIERLHGESVVFKKGHSGVRRYLHQELDWDASYFRCLHAVFVKRSSLDSGFYTLGRLNPDELSRFLLGKGFFKKAIQALKLRIQQMLGLDWKNKKYRRGMLVEKDVRAFL